MSAEEQRARAPRLSDGLVTALRDALIVTFVCSLLAVAINLWAHPKGIPLLASKAYETLVPCPEPGGAVTSMAADDGRIGDRTSFRVDAREAEAFSAWHLSGAMNVTYDYLDPTPQKVMQGLARRAASSRAQRVVVYGDGEDPDSGEQLAKELSGHGIKNVFFVKGGAPALKKARRP